MSSESDSPERNFLSYWKLWVPAVVIFIGAFTFLLAGRSTPKQTKAVERVAAEEDNLREARDILAREVDLAACKAALVKINNHLNLHPDQRPPYGDSEILARLDQSLGVSASSGNALARVGEHLGLNADEMAEAENSSYTPLDSRYLDERLLLRDAAQTLVVKETGLDGKPLVPSPVERASATFRWVMRQVRPGSVRTPSEQWKEPLPPAFALRRGWGDMMERALVFLAMLEQDAGPERLRGCLLAVAGPNKEPQLWACGVVVDDGKDVYLFDPRLGLPLPGPGGEGVATLAAVTKDPAILARLDAGPDNRYDVTAERARTAEALVVLSLTALAPRTFYLQESLLKNHLGARLVQDPNDLARFRDAVKASGGTGASVWKPGTALLRRFLPVEDGGADIGAAFPLGSLRGFTRPDDRTEVRMTRLRYYELTLVPWELMPQHFNPKDFPITVGLGQHVRELFADTFIKQVREPQSARVLLLRGRYDKAVAGLIAEDNLLRDRIGLRAQETQIDKHVAEWLKDAREAYADQQRAQNSGRPTAQAAAAKRIEALWKAAVPVYVLLFGASSGPRDAEVTYQLGLCMQEQAEKYQAGIDLKARAGIPAASSEVERCREKWVGANGWWDRMASDYGMSLAGPPARQNRGRAEAMLGQWEAAVVTWSDVSGPMTPLEKLAALYRARDAKAHVTAKK
jgi:hypothetical protein